jgi:hypothetical protein
VFVDIEVLRKRISTFRGEGGRVRITDEVLLMEILSAWEQWTGPARSFYPAIGVSQKGMASIIGKAKKLRREGHFPVSDFKEIKVDASKAHADPADFGPRTGVELLWENGKVIRFSEVRLLVDFLRAMGESGPSPTKTPLSPEISVKKAA